MTQAYYRKWRPRQWDEVVAQDHVVQTLRNAVRTGRTGHAYLLSGPRGTGKTTTARLLAKALNCLAEDLASRPCDHCAHCEAINAGRFLDLIEIDAASNTSVDDVRDLREKINFSPTQGRYKVYIIDEVHMLSTAAFNALLKTLEEPPPHAIFILATTEVHKIPATILSRVQRYEFRRIPVAQIVRHLREKAAEEGLEVDEDALTLIARQATGAMRDAISLLDQLSSTGQRVTLAEAQVVLGTATNHMVVEMIEAVLERDAARGLNVVQSALDAGTDARQFARQVVDYLRSLLLVRMGNADQVDATQEMRQQMSQHAAAFDNPRLLETIRLFNSAASDARVSWHPGLGLELALAEAVEEKAAAAVPAATAVATATAQPPSERLPAREPARTPPAERLPAQPPARQPQSAPPEGPEEPPEEGPMLYQQNQPAATSRAAPAQATPPTRSAAGPEAGGSSGPETGGPETGASAAGAPESGSAKQAPGGTISAHDIQQNWARIKQLVKTRNSYTSAALNSCRPMGVKEGTLVLAFQSEVVKLKLETPENIEILRQALQHIFGTTLGVRCIVSSSGSAQDDAMGIDGDSMVGTLQSLGGKVVHTENIDENRAKRTRR